MDRKRIGPALWIAAVLLGLFAAAAMFGQRTTNDAATSGSATAQAGATKTSSLTLAPSIKTATPTFTPSPTPSPPMVVANKNAHCRLGPSQYYESIGELLAGDSSPISGRNEDWSWWVIAAAYEGGECWIGDAVVTVSGDLSQVEVIAAPPLLPPAPIPFHPIRDFTCDPGLPHTFLKWHPVDHPLGILRYEWEVQSRDATHAGSTTDTEVEVVLVCGVRYTWRVRAVDTEGTAGPYSEPSEFKMR